MTAPQHTHTHTHSKPQYEAGHSRGSSCGHSRITRRAYEKHYYVEMMNDAYRMWSELERESGSTLYKYETTVVSIVFPKFLL